MDKMPVPQNINAMIETVYPIPRKIFHDKSDNPREPDRFKFINCNMVDQPRIGDDCKGKFYTISNRI